MGSSVSRRILALWLPRLSTDRLQRRAPEPASEPAGPPLVVVDKIDNALRLTAVDRAASAVGLSVDMTLADARARVPGLVAKPADAEADRALLERIADWCDRYTPFVACHPPRALLLDITGGADLFGGEMALLSEVRARLAQQGFAVRGAIAGGTAAARALARYADGAIAPPGEDEAFVVALPVEALETEPATWSAFRRAGLKTVGQVAGRRRGELAARFGADLVFALDRILGRAETPLSPRLPVPSYRTEHRFAEPILTEELVLATLRDLASRLGKIMETHGEGARRLEAAFFRSDGAVRRIVVDMGAPTRTPAIVERLLREKLSALTGPLDPGFGYDVIRLAALKAERVTQGPHAEREVGVLVDRLAARFGGAHLVTFRPNDTHRPEAAAVAVPAQGAGSSTLEWTRIRGDGEAPRRPLRMFARPEPVEVIAEVPEGPPVQFRWRRALHAVAFAEGPERIAMEWWQGADGEPTRDYFRVEDSEGRRFWLYRSGLYARETTTPQWFMHGVFA